MVLQREARASPSAPVKSKREAIQLKKPQRHILGLFAAESSFRVCFLPAQDLAYLDLHSQLRLWDIAINTISYMLMTIVFR